MTKIGYYSDMFTKLSSQLDNIDHGASNAQWHNSELIQNTQDEIFIDASPLFLESVVLAADNDDKKILKEKKNPVEPECMIDRAHPESVFVADALGEGGLVENNNERQEKLIGIINKMPTGNLINTYAALIVEELAEIATELEEKGLSSSAELVDDTMLEIYASFDKKAFAFLAAIPWIAGAFLGAGAIGAGQKFFNAFTSLQEGIVEDTQDLVSNIDGPILGWANDPEYSASMNDINELRRNALFMRDSATNLLQLLNAVKSDPNSTSGEQFSTLQEQFYNALVQSETIVKSLQSLYPGKTKLDFTATLGHLKDIREGYSALGRAINVAGRQRASLPNENLNTEAPVAQQPQQQTPAKPKVPEFARIKEVQSFLNNYYFANSPKKLAETGQLDSDTKDAFEELSQEITTKLGTNSPTAAQLENTTASQLRLLFQLYKNPRVNPIDGTPVFGDNENNL